MNNNKTLGNSHAYFVWFLGSIFFFVDYILRVSPSVLTPSLMQTFNANAFAMGGLSAFFYYAYIGMQIPVGILVDRFGPKRLLIASSLLCALSTLLFAHMHTLTEGFISRFILGFGASFAFVGTLKLISLWFKAEQFAFLAGLTQAMGMVGAMIGQGPMALAYQSWGWRNSMFALSVVFFLLSLLMVIFIKDKNNPQARAAEQHEHKMKIGRSLIAILVNPQNALNCLVIGLLYAPSACFGEQWGASFLSLNQNISIEAAGHSTGMMFIGLAIGCPVMGWISDKLGSRLMVIRTCIVACFLLLFIVIYGEITPGFNHLNPLVFTGILFFYGFFNSGIVPCYALASEINPFQLTGMALGVTNMATVIIGAAMIPIVGLILDKCWNGIVMDNIHVFDLKSYYYAFAPLLLGLIMAFILSFFQKETYCKRLTASESY